MPSQAIICIWLEKEYIIHSHLIETAAVCVIYIEYEFDYFVTIVS